MIVFFLTKLFIKEYDWYKKSLLKSTYLHSLYFCAHLVMIVDIVENLRKIKKIMKI